MLLKKTQTTPAVDDDTEKAVHVGTAATKCVKQSLTMKKEQKMTKKNQQDSNVCLTLL